MNTLKKQQIIQISDVDFNHHLQMSTLFEWLQNMATEHATSLGFGYNDLLSQNRFWAMSRIYLKIHSMPMLNEPITLETWSKGASGPFAMRDFIVTNSAGEHLIETTSAWLMLDAGSKKPVREFGEDFKQNSIAKHAIEEMPLNIKTRELNFIYKTQILYSDLDQNKHMNNCRYVDKVLNAYPLFQFERFRVSELQLNFRKELFWNDEIVAFSHINDLESQVSLQKENEEVLSAQILWKPMTP